MCFKCMQCLWRPKEGVRSPQTGGKNGCQPPCGCRESNLGLLEEQPVLLTIISPALPSFLYFRPYFFFFLTWSCYNSLEWMTFNLICTQVGLKLVILLTRLPEHCAYTYDMFVLYHIVLYSILEKPLKARSFSHHWVSATQRMIEWVVEWVGYSG